MDEPPNQVRALGDISTSRGQNLHDLGELLRKLTVESDRVAQRFAQKNRLHGTDFRGLTLIHAAEIEGTPLTASGLGAALRLSSGAVTHLVDRLVEAGHVVRDTDPRDGRRVVLRYSEHGHETASAYFLPLAMHLTEGMAGHDEEELRAARSVMTAMLTALRTFDES